MTLSTVRCQILGRAEIHTRGIRLTPESELQFGLALFFCGNPGRQVPRDDVARLFWPQSGLEAARHNLRQSLYRLRVLGVPVRSGAKSSVLETHLVEADFLPVVAEGAPASVYLRMTDVSVLPGYSPKFSAPSRGGSRNSGRTSGPGSGGWCARSARCARVVVIRMWSGSVGSA